MLARDGLTVAGRARLFHSDHRLATEALPDKIDTLWAPTDKMQSAPLFPTPHCMAHHRADEPCEIKDLSHLVVSSGRWIGK